jgi:3-hydroxyacyl-CoA dehydrogenase
MLKLIESVAVLGAGVMGTQIAVHLANAGLRVWLLDLAAPGDNPNAIIETALKKAQTLSPPITFTEHTLRRIRVGNYNDDFDRVGEVDWVIEAVIEELAVKRTLMARIEGVVQQDAIVSSNTSGLSLAAIAEGCPERFRHRFLGTHFFNPPRYLKLMELIPTLDTDPQVLAGMQEFMRLRLGKGVVIARDTPNFIANRIGVYATMLAMKAWLTLGYTIAEIDALTGPVMGRPKSATFRTADLVGLDTLVAVCTHLHQATMGSEAEGFAVPDLLRTLVKLGRLGAKTGQGFYHKQGKEILALNATTLDYEPSPPLNLGELAALEGMPKLGDRLDQLYTDPGRAGQFLKPYLLNLLAYTAQVLPTIAESPLDLDRAMRWGFGWEQGPFELWDSLGFRRIVADLETASISIPDWITDMVRSGVTSFYTKAPVEATPSQVVGPQGRVPLRSLPDELSLDRLAMHPERVLWQNAESALIDLGDGVVGFDLRSKGQTLSRAVLTGLSTVLDLLTERDDLLGLVIGNDREHFCGGANLLEMGQLAQAQDVGAIAKLLEQFQTVFQRIRYFHKPIVAAIQGRALGGGCELVMACPHAIAAAESYIGLVELGVGLIPGAGGITRMAIWAADHAATETNQDILPFLQRAFETIALGKVSRSAEEAKVLGYLPDCSSVIMNGDRRLYLAKQRVLHLADMGYAPPPRRDTVMVLGQPARTILTHRAWVLQQGGYISEYDYFLADQLAQVITGGDLVGPTLVSEGYLLGLERQHFLPLLGQPKTQERVAHLLKTKKPLRN